MERAGVGGEEVGGEREREGEEGVESVVSRDDVLEVVEAVSGCGGRGLWRRGGGCGGGTPPKADGWVRSLLSGVEANFGLRRDCARCMTSAPPTKKMVLTPDASSLWSMQAIEDRRRRRARRLRMSEVATGELPKTSRCTSRRAVGSPTRRRTKLPFNHENQAFSKPELAEQEPIPGP